MLPGQRHGAIQLAPAPRLAPAKLTQACAALRRTLLHGPVESGFHGVVVVSMSFAATGHCFQLPGAGTGHRKPIGL